MTQLTNCYAWYKPESLSSAYSDGDPIDSWADSSGNGRDISNTLTSRPTALANAFGTYMAADFDGSSDYLSSASYTQSGDVVVTAVFSLDVLKNFNTIHTIDAQSPPTFNAGTPNTQWNTLLVYDAGHVTLVQVDTAYTAYWTKGFTSYLLSAGTNYLVSCAASELGRFIRVNGTAFTASTINLTTPTTPSSGNAHITLGYSGLGGSFLNGKIVEFVAYDAVSTDFPEVSWVEGYLADKYSITLPAGHLFKNEPPANAPTTYNPSGGGGGAVLHPLRSN